MRKHVTVGALSLGLLIPVSMPEKAAAGVPLPFATEYTQLLNYAQLVGQLAKTAQQVQYMFHELQYVIQNSQNLGAHPFTAIMSDLSTLSNVIVQSQGLAYSLGALDRQFAAMYPSYNPSPLADWTTQYMNWSTNTIKTMQGTLAAAGVQGAGLMNEQVALQQLQLLSQSPMGQDQAIQLGNAMSAETISQLVKLRQLMISDMQSKAAYTGLQVNQQLAVQQAATQGFTDNTWTADQRAW
jgi:type IV secretion system protein TrbJ